MKNRFALLSFLAIFIFISATIDLENLPNYGNQDIPSYITRDNTPGNNPITDIGATLGRVLFYDKNLSANNTVACASCHHQQFAFSDTALRSVGLNAGLTGRHAMRLVNARFSDETNFFWDERASSVEDQSTKPIQDHIEMGFSGSNGDPDLDSLIRKMEQIDYYQKLFPVVFGDSAITEERMQLALAQFVRSIQSFDSKYDIGRAQVNNDNQDFPNYTTQENEGKQLFLAPPNLGGAGCQGCHRAPEFDIDPNSDNNGIVGNLSDTSQIDVTNTRAPSLRDLVNPDGDLNGPLMHDGSIKSLEEVVDHYDQIEIVAGNNNLDNRLTPGGQPQNLGLSQAEKDALVAFLKTLTGSDVYSNPKWSDPFDENGNLVLENVPTAVNEVEKSVVSIYPNPVINVLNFKGVEGVFNVRIFDLNGSLVKSRLLISDQSIDLSNLPNGMYLIQVWNESFEISEKIIKL